MWCEPIPPTLSLLDASAWRPPDTLSDEDLRLGGLSLLARLGEELAARH